MDFIINLIAIISSILIFIYVFYSSLILFLSENYINENKNKKTENFEYIFLIPCLNESLVIKNTIQSIDALDYKNKLIVVIDDNSSDNTIEIVKNTKIKSRLKIIARKSPNAQQGKGEALNFSFKKIMRAVKILKKDASKIILIVIDGDGRPSKNLLLESNKVFLNDKVGAAQTRISITNKNRLLPLFQDIEFFSIISAIQNSRTYFGSVCLGGNGQCTRLSALASLGEKPWSKCLLEDFDLGLSILLKNWKICYIGNAVVYQQGLTSLKKFIKQRSRWVQGNLQSLARLKEIKNSNLKYLIKLDIYYFLSQPFLNLINSIIIIITYILSFMLIFSFIKYDISLFNSESIFLISLIIFLTFGTSSIWSIYHYNICKKNNENFSIKYAIIASFMIPFYNVITIPSVWIACIRHLFNKNTWIKTERLNE